MSETSVSRAPPSHAPTIDHRASKPLVLDHLPAAWSPSNLRPSLPIGVALLSVLIAISGVVVLVAGSLFLLNTYFGTVVPTSLLIVRSVDPLGAGILVLVGAVLLSVANALWAQERWALWTTVAVLFAALAYSFFTASITVLFLLFLLLFIYLLTVRRYFY
ncbi:MAG: hypothetical protein L3K19_05160 [Thermoplasmata archaeon]|nr:hypothetical protein [Thermoplasmata archaeon]